MTGRSIVAPQPDQWLNAARPASSEIRVLDLTCKVAVHIQLWRDAKVAFDALSVEL